MAEKKVMTAEDFLIASYSKFKKQYPDDYNHYEDDEIKDLPEFAFCLEAMENYVQFKHSELSKLTEDVEKAALIAYEANKSVSAYGIFSIKEQNNRQLFKEGFLAGYFLNGYGQMINVKDRMPENVGNYLCITNDLKWMVCYLAANGWWSKVPDAEYYGDMGKCVIDSKEVDRQVTHWQPLPSPPNP